MNRITAILLVLLQVGIPWSAWSRAPFSPTAISLPPGFQISLFAENLPNARSMASGPDGILFVGTRKAGRVYALVDRDVDFKADQTIVLAEGVRNSVGFDYHPQILEDGSMPVSDDDAGRIYRITYQP